MPSRTSSQDSRRALNRLHALGHATPSAGWVPEQPADVVAASDPLPTPSSLGRPAPTLRELAAASLGDRLPMWLRAEPDQWTKRPLAALALVCVACLAVTGYVLLHGHHAAASSPVGEPSVAALPSAPPAVQLVVDVGGRVRHPGLVNLPPGSRVADAIRAAGGALRPADVATVDLAAKVTDGQLLLIGVPGALGGAPAGASSPPTDLNTATTDQLDALPGVGPVLAQHIVDWRQAHGGFTSVDQLQQVPGIGPRKFDELKALVTA